MKALEIHPVLHTDCEPIHGFTKVGSKKGSYKNLIGPFFIFIENYKARKGWVPKYFQDKVTRVEYEDNLLLNG